ncbi:HAD family phosphatase [Ktedonosporobacter rubrisoli]|uniref:HAD family phosphatase n=1 Tax=Ktedonosporobacter rubrisoli TaxID=2509675 RepID=A0A4P6JLN7_KTERU|nr:HAD family phosphatase [Ktedonosporobacter rubrisoli]QBD75993.1 HAD family phosphatase [Ktedonosporobacter rubrisoli]
MRQHIMCKDSQQLPYEAICFDMDGVIVDTRFAVTSFWQRLAAEYALTLTLDDFDHHIYGCSANHTLETLFPLLSKREQEEVYIKLEQYEQNSMYREIPGAIALLRQLHAAHLPLALVTSAHRWKVGRVLQQLGLEQIFAAQITVQDIVRGKPDPACYIQAAQALGKHPSCCVAFEDAKSGVLAARAAGMECCGVREPSLAQVLLDAGASIVIPDLTAVVVTFPAQARRRKLPGWICI